MANPMLADNLDSYDDGDLNLGAGAATDVDILFDGNEEDFHVALDDSANTLNIRFVCFPSLFTFSKRGISKR